MHTIDVTDGNETVVTVREIDEHPGDGSYRIIKHKLVLSGNVVKRYGATKVSHGGVLTYQLDNDDDGDRFLNDRQPKCGTRSDALKFVDSLIVDLDTLKRRLQLFVERAGNANEFKLLPTLGDSYAAEDREDGEDEEVGP